MKRIFRSKIFWSIVVVLVVVRIAVPPLILREANHFLEKFSPLFVGHIADINLDLYRSAYRAEGFELRLKEKRKEQFVYLKEIDVSLAWRDLLKGRITADVVLDGLKVVVTDNVINALKDFKQVQEDQKKASNKLIPVRIERIDVRDSSFEMADMLKIPEGSRLRLTGIQGRVSNVTPSKSAPITLATTKANLFDSAPIKIVAQINRLAQPLAWDLDVEMRDFKLPEANPYLKNKLPLTFTSGTLDIYSELKSEDGRIEGYVKPFVHKADVVANGEHFLSLKHFGIEASTATINLLLRNARNKTLATKILFSYDNDGFKLNSAKAISDAIKNGFSDPIQPGIEDQISLSAFHEKATKGDKP